MYRFSELAHKTQKMALETESRAHNNKLEDHGPREQYYCVG
jgi:hypothetical protein